MGEREYIREKSRLKPKQFFSLVLICIKELQRNMEYFNI